MRFDQKIYGAQENSKTKLIRSCSNSTERERRNQTTFFSRCMSIEAPHSVQVYHTFNEDADWDHLQGSSRTSFCGDFLKFVVSLDVIGGRWTLPVRHTNSIGSLLPPSIYLLRWGHKLQETYYDEKRDLLSAYDPLKLFWSPAPQKIGTINISPSHSRLIMSLLIPHLIPIIGHNIYHLFQDDGNRARLGRGTLARSYLVCPNISWIIRDALWKVIHLIYCCREETTKNHHPIVVFLLMNVVATHSALYGSPGGSGLQWLMVQLWQFAKSVIHSHCNWVILILVLLGIDQTKNDYKTRRIR